MSNKKPGCRLDALTRTDLVDSADLALNAVVLCPGATRPLVSRHVNADHVLVSGEKLEEKTNAPNLKRGGPHLVQCITSSFHPTSSPSFFCTISHS